MKVQQVETVLLVDDDENWCFLSRIILKKAGIGGKIITTQNGLEAIEKLQAMAASGNKLPEVIFLDIKMPVMDGFEFLEEVFKSTDLNLSRTKIYMCTSSMHPQDQEQAYLYPIAGFLTKPLTPEVLKDILV